MPTLAGKLITQNGLGLMNDVTNDEKTFKILKAALAAGVNVWNGAAFYGTTDNVLLYLMNRYFTAYPEDAETVALIIQNCVVDMHMFTMDGPPAASVPIEETIGALAGLVNEGKVGGTKMSEVSSDTTRLSTTKVFENDVAETCAQLRIIMVAHIPLGAGMFTGQIKSLGGMPENDYHRAFSRFKPKNFGTNLQLVAKIRENPEERRARRLSLRFLG
ncbi:aldo/keto reductase [Penicillium sp. IBT 35674x]|nr:aldo/keto reductase [Penicillium sp. IBT 35674x]